MKAIMLGVFVGAVLVGLAVCSTLIAIGFAGEFGVSPLAAALVPMPVVILEVTLLMRIVVSR